MELDFTDFVTGKKIIVENWTSENEIIDNFIKNKQLEYDGNDTVFEWIPFNKLIITKEAVDNCLTTAVWNEGPLYYYNGSNNKGLSYYDDDSDDNAWIRESYKRVILRFLNDSQNITDEFINKIESYLPNNTSYKDCEWYYYGISQNPETKVCILVFSEKYSNYFCEKCGNKYENEYSKYCVTCQMNHLRINFTNRISGNEKIDSFIQEKQLKYKGGKEVFEWIPNNEFIYIKETGDNCLITAIWKDGPLSYDRGEWIRTSRKRVTLRFFDALQNITDEFINKIESYLSNNKSDCYYGISKNPDTKVYTLVFNDKYLDEYCINCDNKYENRDNKWCEPCQISYLKGNFTNWTSRNVKLDNFIKEKQLKINKFYDKIFEWIPYDKFIKINEIDRENGFATALLKDGPLFYNTKEKRLMRESYKNVCLKYLYNSQNITDEFLDEVESYLKSGSYGISQNQNTKVYMLVFYNAYFDYYCEKCDKSIQNTWCRPCQLNRLKDTFPNWTSGNEKIDCLIQKLQLYIKNHNDTIFEWIPHNEFINIKETVKSDFVTAIWKVGPSCYSKLERKYKRKLNEEVLLKHLYDSQNINHMILNKIANSIKESYGLSQDPDTKDLILVLQPKYYCQNCGKRCNNRLEMDNKICALCHTSHENNKIQNLIREMRSNINYNFSKLYIIFEWIPYDQFVDIKKVGKGGFSIVYSAMWKDGLFTYDEHNNKWKRKSNIRVALKCLNDSQNFPDKFINEVKVYPNQKIDNIIKIYGISQNPDTKDYIIVFEYAEGGNFNDYLEKNYKSFDWCWDSNPDNRPNCSEIKESIDLFYHSLDQNFKEKKKQHYEIEKQFNDTQECRKKSLLSVKNNQSTTHTQAIYISRLLNPYTAENLPRCDDNINNNTVPITDFTNL
ncbi:kinase-like domain-containing protein [Rhizophagus clarus]|uniref:Kinase-like domain-containing protein n=1 Tax=Rhizophagus clarus TaxID=94130 RepID=A0A8H3LZR6_9GLOM|nr:kinase-like domain-containing protein [Rhizophagus clarus]